MEKYRFRTSFGWVVLSLDKDKFEASSNFGEPVEEMNWNAQNKTFKIESGKEFIDKLYDGSLSSIIRLDDGTLFAIIHLDDCFYGCPEYLLEKIE